MATEIGSKQPVLQVILHFLCTAQGQGGCTAVFILINMVMCFVPDCKHYSEKHRCSFHRFPKNEKEKKTWIENIGRIDKVPTEYSKVCSCHFKDNVKKNGPTIFERDVVKALQNGNYTKTKRRKNVDHDENNVAESSSQELKISFHNDVFDLMVKTTDADISSNEEICQERETGNL